MRRAAPLAAASRALGLAVAALSLAGRAEALSGAAGAPTHPPDPASSAALPPITAAVIIPGFLTGRAELEPLARSLTERCGIPSVVVPMPAWHWIPCLGGRSARPILERIDVAVRHLAASGGEVGSVPAGLVGYGAADCWGDFRDNPGGVAEVGGSAEVDEYPGGVEPRGTFPPAPSAPRGRVALVGHSAGGWIGRAYLSERPYGGRVYAGSRLVHSLVTLGTPHGDAPGPAFRGVEWINREGLPKGVRGLAVAGAGYPGDSSGDFTRNSYGFCLGGDGSAVDGDGVTPVGSALSFPGAETMVLDGCTHFPWSEVLGGGLVAPDLARSYREEEGAWYGSDGVIEKWAGWLKEGE